MVGDQNEKETPVPISNTEVKLFGDLDGTAFAREIQDVANHLTLNGDLLLIKRAHPQKKKIFLNSFNKKNHICSGGVARPNRVETNHTGLSAFGRTPVTRVQIPARA
jgi:predicted metalloprotease